MKQDTFEKKIKDKDEWDDIERKTPQKIRGILVPPSKAMTTVLGKRVHYIDESNSAMDKSLSAVIGLCGAGAPNRQFPNGSSIYVRRDIDTSVIGKKRLIPVDCYKCMKLMYMNKYASNEQIAIREFDPSNQQPDGHTLGNLVTLTQALQIDPSEISYILRRGVNGNTLVLYSEEENQKGEKLRVHVVAPFGQEDTYAQIFGNQGIVIKNTRWPQADTYERRSKHIMMPMGRFGVFGSDMPIFDPNGDPVYNDSILSQRYQIDEPEDGFNEDMSWVEDYFKSSNNKWRVGATNRKTQQKRKTKQIPIVITQMLSVYFDEILVSNIRQSVVDNVINNAYEFYIALRSLPIEQFVTIPLFKSTLAAEIQEQIKKERKVEIKAYEEMVRQMEREEQARKLEEKAKKQQQVISDALKPPSSERRRRRGRRRRARENPTLQLPYSSKVVPQMLDQLNHFDKLFSEVEAQYAQGW